MKNAQHHEFTSVHKQIWFDSLIYEQTNLMCNESFKKAHRRSQWILHWISQEWLGSLYFLQFQAVRSVLKYVNQKVN